MAVAGGLDLHRGQLTFDYVDLGTGEAPPHVGDAQNWRIRPFVFGQSIGWPAAPSRRSGHLRYRALSHSVMIGWLPPLSWCPGSAARPPIPGGRRAR